MLTRVFLAVPKNDLRTHILEILRTLDSIAMSVPSRKKLASSVVNDPFDILIVSEGWLPTPPEKFFQILLPLPDAPQVIVLSDTEDPKKRAHLLAAGCDAVIYASLPRREFEQTLRAIIQRRLDMHEELIAEHIEPMAKPSLSDFVSNSIPMQTFMKLVKRVIKTDSSLLITGETGVGKERLARAIHAEGARREEPFIPVNCAALPENLLESELFGHERGAFTGATTARRGVFEVAHRGTIFLDEIGEMPVKLQAKLLRVLQEKEFVRVGGEKPIRVDVRLMAATNRDLVRECDQGRFRRDLYFRLSVVTLLIPALRERREDIQELVKNYIAYLGPRINAVAFGIKPRAMEALTAYDWPGNVRELINVIERGLLLSDGEMIALCDLPDEIARRSTASPPAPSVADGEWSERPWKEIRARVLEETERAYLDAVLRACHGRIASAAQRAGIAPRNLYEKMKAHGLRKEDYKP